MKHYEDLLVKGRFAALPADSSKSAKYQWHLSGTDRSGT